MESFGKLTSVTAGLSAGCDCEVSAISLRPRRDPTPAYRSDGRTRLLPYMHAVSLRANEFMERRHCCLPPQQLFYNLCKKKGHYSSLAIMHSTGLLRSSSLINNDKLKRLSQPRQPGTVFAVEQRSSVQGKHLKCFNFQSSDHPELQQWLQMCPE